MSYHEPFPQIDNNEHIYGGREALPYKCAQLIYNVLCSIDSKLDNSNPIAKSLPDDLRVALEGLKTKKEPEAEKIKAKPGRKPKVETPILPIEGEISEK